MTFELATNDGERLEAQWSKPLKARGVVTFCHPHPLHQGTMNAPLMVAVTDRLVAAGLAVLRFNFRGVGRSTGSHGGGEAEQSDVAAAVAEAGFFRPELPHGLAGWSFGAATSLNWLATSGSSLPWVGIAPPVRSERTPSLPPKETLASAGILAFILGERDQFTSVEELDAYATSVGGSLTVLSSDHFFHGKGSQVGELVGELLFELPEAHSGGVEPE